MSTTTAPATTRLIGIGNVPAVPLSDVRPGDRIVWNYGQTYTVVRNTKVAANTYELVERGEDGREWTRRKRGTKLVARRPGIERAPATPDVTLTWPAGDTERDELRAQYLAATTDEQRRTAAMALGGDVPLGCSGCGARQFVDSAAEEEAWWAVHGGADEPCTADTPDETEPLAVGETFTRMVRGVGRRAKPRTVTYTVTGYAEGRGGPIVLVRSDYQGDGSMPVSMLREELAGEEDRRARSTSDPRAVTGTPENIDARASARARGELAAQASLTFDESDRQAMTLAQLRAAPAGALALF